jgi:predicted branched-subunit amino acid permease
MQYFFFAVFGVLKKWAPIAARFMIFYYLPLEFTWVKLGGLKGAIFGVPLSPNKIWLPSLLSAIFISLKFGG